MFNEYAKAFHANCNLVIRNEEHCNGLFQCSEAIILSWWKKHNLDVSHTQKLFSFGICLNIGRCNGVSLRNVGGWCSFEEARLSCQFPFKSSGFCHHCDES